MDTDSPNPYASPAAVPLPVEPESADSEVGQLRAFVGPKADYYLRQWGPLISHSAGKVGFNWAAFLFSGIWLLYRKMYRFAAIFFGLVIVESVLEVVLFVMILQEPEPPRGLQNVIGIAIAAVCGAFGNRWYYAHATARVAEVRGQGLEGDALARELSMRGGTSLLSALGLFCVFVVALSGALVFLEIAFGPGLE